MEYWLLKKKQKRGIGFYKYLKSDVYDSNTDYWRIGGLYFVGRGKIEGSMHCGMVVCKN